MSDLLISVCWKYSPDTIYQQEGWRREGHTALTDPHVTLEGNTKGPMEEIRDLALLQEEHCQGRGMGTWMGKCMSMDTR